MFLLSEIEYNNNLLSINNTVVCETSDLSISVGNTQVSASSKVRHLGVFFKTNISLFMIILVIFASLLIFTCVASE